MTAEIAPKLHVVIVDDEELVRVALRRFCRAWGMHATAFPSGRALVDALDTSSCAPDCLVLDAHMPDMSGIEILHQLLSRAVRFPTIIYSADDEPEAVDRFIGAGAVAYLRKPILGEELVAAIERATGHTP